MSSQTLKFKTQIVGRGSRSSRLQQSGGMGPLAMMAISSLAPMIIEPLLKPMLGNLLGRGLGAGTKLAGQGSKRRYKKKH